MSSCLPYWVRVADQLSRKARQSLPKPIMSYGPAFNHELSAIHEARCTTHLGMISAVPMVDPNAWFIAVKKRTPVRFWIEVWLRSIWKYTKPKRPDREARGAAR